MFHVQGLFLVTGGLILIEFAVGTLEYLVRFSIQVVSCLCTCKSRIKAEIADAKDDADQLVCY